jgi:hypothetical protein
MFKHLATELMKLLDLLIIALNERVVLLVRSFLSCA